MANERKIKDMDIDGLTAFLKSFQEVCPHTEYADIEAWLESEDEEMIWKGKRVSFQGRTATLVDESVLYGKLYDVLIQDDGTMVKVPRKKW